MFKMKLIKNSLNNQFKLYDVLLKLSDTLVEFLYNNININYYCIVEKRIKNKIYIVTSNTLKNCEIGHRLIIITENDTNYDTHTISSCGTETIIYFENYYIKIGQCINNINKINKNISHMGINIEKIEDKKNIMIDNTMHSRYSYDPNINESTVFNIVHNTSDNISIQLYNGVKFIDIIDVNFNINLLQFPSSITKIQLGTKTDYYPVLFRKTPKGVKIQSNVLPLNLHTLIFGFYYKEKINANVLPLNLHTLIFGDLFNNYIDDDVLPSSLVNLVFGNYLCAKYNKKLQKNVLPLSLRLLLLPMKYNVMIDKGVLPPTLDKLIFRGYEFKSKQKILPVNFTAKLYFINTDEDIDKHLFN